MKPIQISFRQLSVFDAVARTGSVSQAAIEISLGQSATSLSLRELEKSLGASLFERIGKKLVLNANGHRLRPQAHSLLQQGQDFYLDKGSEVLAGVIRLAASSTIGQYLLPQICSGFISRHPAVQVDLSIASTIEVIVKTEQMTVDLGLIEGPCHQRSLASSTWLEDRLVFLQRPATDWLTGRVCFRYKNLRMSCGLSSLCISRLAALSSRLWQITFPPRKLHLYRPASSPSNVRFEQVTEWVVFPYMQCRMSSRAVNLLSFGFQR